LSDTEERIINFQKAIKFAVKRDFMRLPPTPEGDEIIEIPEAKIVVGHLLLQILDAPFEAQLGRIFVTGLSEQINRIKREELLAETLRRLSLNTSLEMQAWELLKEGNSRTWINKLQKFQPAPALVSYESHNVRIEMRPQVLKDGTTIPEAIAQLDGELPTDLRWDIMVPIDLRFSQKAARLWFRDYQPMLEKSFENGSGIVLNST
ncbi:hypothetical protein HDU93_005035, partial [Gonapodya sp. JEL0774]